MGDDVCLWILGGAIAVFAVVTLYSWTKRPKAEMQRHAAQCVSRTDLSSELRRRKERLRRDVADLQAKGLTSGDIRTFLDQMHDSAMQEYTVVAQRLRISSPDFDEVNAWMTMLSQWQSFIDNERRELWSGLARSLERARQWEHEGELAKAIPVYEALIADSFEGTMPYDRLRIIYTREKRFEDAIRVCEAFLRNVPVNPHTLKPAHPQFEHHRDRLRVKLERQP